MVHKTARRALVPPFMVMDVMRDAAALEAQGRRIIHLEVGQPSTGIPKGALPKLKELMDADPLGYTLAAGIPPLQERIARNYADRYGVRIAPERIFITMGSSAAFQLAFLSAFEPGDRVALATPGYPAYRHILTALGVEPVLMVVEHATRFQPTVEMLKRLSPQPDGLILASPANPTGTVIPTAELDAIARYCHDNGIRLISDEIYHGITYNMPVATAVGRADSAVVINSFSKYYSMTGWRVGWLVLPTDLLRPVECVAQNFFISPPTVSQYAALAAFDCTDELDANVARYARNREVLLANLPKLGFERFAPADGAFYIYADVTNFGIDAHELCRRMLHEAGVAATPGIDFDPVNGSHYVRFSFAGSTPDMVEACERLKAWRR